MTIFETIRNETERCAQKIALVEGEHRVTYGQLLTAAENVAEVLSARGVCRFHRVGLLAEDSCDYVIVSLAILSLSAVVVPVSPEQTPAEILTVIERIDVDFIVSEPRLLPDGQDGDPLPSDNFVASHFSLSSRTPISPPPPEYFNLNPAFIRFSSGTTGTSKGVVLSHQSIIDRTAAADKGMQITADDTVLWVLSMSYHFVVTILLFLRRGATIVLCSHRFPEALIEGILVHTGTFIYASPFHYNLLSRTDALEADSLKHIRMAISTAMKLPDLVAATFYDKFGFELTEAYGIIEVGLPFLTMADGRKQRGSVGKALPDYAIALDNKDNDELGEILIRGKGMLDAYYSPWQSRQDILSDGWFRTGDLGTVDEDGFLYILGRKKDVINFVGMKIFAHEVESVINQHSQVKESLVYGVPHAHYGELPVAKVVLRDREVCDTIDTDDLKRFCYQRLAQYKVPKEFQLVTDLPKTASGKLKR